eukprot:10085690-Alexandrium_andersonii.AAC.1
MLHHHRGATPWVLAGRESTSTCRAAVAGVRGCAAVSSLVRFGWERACACSCHVGSTQAGVA